MAGSSAPVSTPPSHAPHGRPPVDSLGEILGSQNPPKNWETLTPNSELPSELTKILGNQTSEIPQEFADEFARLDELAAQLSS